MLIATHLIEMVAHVDWAIRNYPTSIDLAIHNLHETARTRNPVLLSGKKCNKKDLISLSAFPGCISKYVIRLCKRWKKYWISIFEV